MLGRRKRGGDKEPAPPWDAYNGLRSVALGAADTGLSDPAPTHPNVRGVVVDVPAQGGFVTFVALSDNTTSMYTSAGGGTLGAGERPHVAEANHRLLATIEGQLALFADPDDQSLPSKGAVRFHVLAPTGPRRADIPEDAFWGRLDSPLMPVIAATQQLISAIREVSPS